MERLYWESFSFAPGVHTHHAWTEAGEIFAYDMRNVRADENAYLRLRQPTGTLRAAQPTDGVVGICATDTHLFWVQSDGTLHAINLDDNEQAEVLGAGDIAGRLFCVDQFKDFMIGKSEGTERGFWSDISDPYFIPVTDDGDIPVTTSGDFASTEDEFVAFGLGIDPPELDGLNITFGEFDGPRLTTGYVYVFRFTYVRVQGDFNDVIERGTTVLSQSPILMEGMESDLSEPLLYYVGDARGVTFRSFVDRDKHAHQPTATGANRNVITFRNFEQSIDPQATGVFLYQSEPVPFGGDPINVDNLEYRLVDYVHRDDERQTLGVTGRSEAGNWADQPKARVDNHRLPSIPAQITYYNDLVFAAVGSELRYSDIRDGAPVQWAWPEANSIRADGDVLFCVEHRGVLLYGGPQGIYRLTGTDEFNFNANDQIAAIGPVSRLAWGKFENGIGFISRAGFHITDGVSVQKVSSPFLDKYFEDSPAVDGAVVMLPNEDELWSVVFENNERLQFVRSHRGGFFVWDAVDARQFAVTDDILFVDGLTDEVRTVEGLSTPLDTSVGWYWFSNEIDFKEQGHAEAMKVFKWLEVSSSHNGRGLLHVIVDGVEEDDPRVFSFRADTQRPVRVPIRRRGERIQFRVSGTGEVILRSLRLMAEVRSSRRRF